MSYSVDLNILLYASDGASPRHAAAVRFMELLTSDPDLLCLTWPTLMGYVRISTHPRVFGNPLSPARAIQNVEALISRPRVRVLTEMDDFLTIYRDVTSAFPVRGDLVSDAHLASILRQHGVRRLYTADADFRKFPFLEVLDPFA